MDRFWIYIDAFNYIAGVALIVSSIGFKLGLGIAFLVYYLKNPWRSED